MEVINFFDSNVLRNAAHLCDLIYDAHGDEDLLKSCLNNELNISSVMLGATGSPEYSFCLAVDRNSVLYMCFKGSSAMKDWTGRNLKATQAWNSFGFTGAVHQGFANAASQAAVSTLKAYIRNGLQAVICGHSLGGAIAMLSAARILSSELDQSCRSRLSVITFGAPCVADDRFGLEVLQRSERFYNFVHSDDVIPKILYHGFLSNLLRIPKVDEQTGINQTIKDMVTAVVAEGTKLLSKEIFPMYAPFGLFYMFSAQRHVSKLTSKEVSKFFFLNVTSETNPGILTTLRSHTMESYRREVCQKFCDTSVPQPDGKRPHAEVLELCTPQLISISAYLDTASLTICLRAYGSNVDTLRISAGSISFELAIESQNKKTLSVNVTNHKHSYRSNCAEFILKIIEGANQIDKNYTHGIHPQIKGTFSSIYKGCASNRFTVSLGAGAKTPQERIMNHGITSVLFETCTFLQARSSSSLRDKNEVRDAIEESGVKEFGIRTQSNAKSIDSSISHNKVPDLNKLQLINSSSISQNDKMNAETLQFVDLKKAVNKIDHWINLATYQRPDFRLAAKLLRKIMFLEDVDVSFVIGKFLDCCVDDDLSLKFLNLQIGPVSFLRDKLPSLDVIEKEPDVTFTSALQCFDESTFLEQMCRPVRKELNVLSIILAAIVSVTLMKTRVFEKFLRGLRVIGGIYWDALKITGAIIAMSLSAKFRALITPRSVVAGEYASNDRYADLPEMHEISLLWSAMQSFLENQKISTDDVKSLEELEQMFCDKAASSQGVGNEEMRASLRRFASEVMVPIQELRTKLRVGYPLVVSIVGEPKAGKSCLIKRICSIERDSTGRELSFGIEHRTSDIRMYTSPKAPSLTFRDFPGIHDKSATLELAQPSRQFAELALSSAVILVAKLSNRAFDLAEVISWQQKSQLPCLLLLTYSIDHLKQLSLDIRNKNEGLITETDAIPICLPSLQACYQSVCEAQSDNQTSVKMCVLDRIYEQDNDEYVQQLKNRFQENFLLTDDVLPFVLDWLAKLANRSNMNVEAGQILRWKQETEHIRRVKEAKLLDQQVARETINTTGKTANMHRQKTSATVEAADAEYHSWSTTDVGDWLQRLPLKDKDAAVKAFIDEDITGYVLSDITDDFLKSMSIKGGDRLIILKAIRQFPSGAGM